MKVSETSVIVKGLRLFARHGVNQEERLVGNDFVVDAQLWYDAQQAMATDNVAYALNYGTVVDIIKAEMARPSSLLEFVAARIVAALNFQLPVITRGELTISKVTPPLSAQLEAAAFTVSWIND